MTGWNGWMGDWGGWMLWSWWGQWVVCGVLAILLGVDTVSLILRSRSVRLIVSKTDH